MYMNWVLPGAYTAYRKMFHFLIKQKIEINKPGPERIKNPDHARATDSKENVYSIAIISQLAVVYVSVRQVTLCQSVANCGV